MEVGGALTRRLFTKRVSAALGAVGMLLIGLSVRPWWAALLVVVGSLATGAGIGWCHTGAWPRYCDYCGRRHWTTRVSR
jgi:hypothetical protein